MIRPWQVWCLFALCLVVALPAMGWLTVKAVQLDRAEATARASAELEQEIGWALWQMDTAVTPLLAQEAARPHFLYRPYIYNSANGKATQRVPSPLLEQPSEFVMLHFQRDASGAWSSPQLPVTPRSAVQKDTKNTDTISENGRLPAQLETACRDIDFLDALPKETVDEVQPNASDSIAWNVQSGPQPNPNRQSLEQSSQQAQAAAQTDQPQASNFVAQNPDFQYQERSRAFQNLGQQAIRQQREGQNWLQPIDNPIAAEGISRPIWIGDKLLYARLVTINGEAVVQGCWLNWPRLKQWLMQDTVAYLPGADLIPMTRDNPQFRHRMMASLPVALEVPPLPLQPSTHGPIRIALAVAWVCLLLATVAVAILLLGVIRLSERRATFVSAVTHELRTPLTTFRMYSEMLADDMVKDPEQRGEYLRTLTSEADRLTHLVENVLAFARLERGRSETNHETVSIDQLLQRSKDRLNERAAAAQMELTWDTDATVAARTIRTNCSAIEQILFNLIENACKYADQAENRTIEIKTQVSSDELMIRVADHGPGIPRDVAKRLFHPFHKSSEEAARTAPGVGLGLALSRRLARDLGGDLQRDSSVSTGACFRLRLPLEQTGA